MIKFHYAAYCNLGQNMKVTANFQSGVTRDLEDAVYDSETDTLTLKIKDPESKENLIYLNDLIDIVFYLDKWWWIIA